MRYEEPGPYVGARPKEIYVAETRAVLKGEDESQAVRTILGRDVVRGPKKDRWNPLYTSGDEPPYQEIQDFRQRQHHEQAYRIGVYDQFLDAGPCGYDKQSPNPKRPRFPRGPLQMLGWLVALMLNAIMDLADQLPTRFHQGHERTIRRTFFNRPRHIYLTPEASSSGWTSSGSRRRCSPSWTGSMLPSIACRGSTIVCSCSLFPPPPPALDRDFLIGAQMGQNPVGC